MKLNASTRLRASSLGFLNEFGLQAVEQEPGYFIVEPVDLQNEQPDAVEGYVRINADGTCEYRFSTPHAEQQNVSEGKFPNVNSLERSLRRLFTKDSAITGSKFHGHSK